MPIALLPRPSIAATLVIGTSILGGLAFGVAAAGALLVAARLGRA